MNEIHHEADRLEHRGEHYALLLRWHRTASRCFIFRHLGAGPEYGGFGSGDYHSLGNGDGKAYGYFYGDVSTGDGAGGREVTPYTENSQKAYEIELDVMDFQNKSDTEIDWTLLDDET